MPRDVSAETDSEIRTLTEESHQDVMSLDLLPYFDEPEDVASACTYLSSDEATYVMGTTLCVNGGVSFEGRARMRPPAPRSC